MSEQRTDTKGAYQDKVEVTGRVLAVDIPKGQCQLWLDDSTYVPLAFTEKQEPCIANALMSRKHRELTALGVGEFTPDGALKRVIRADQLSLSYDFEKRDPDAPDLMETLDKLFSDLPEEEWENVPTDFAKLLSERGHGILGE